MNIRKLNVLPCVKSEQLQNTVSQRGRRLVSKIEISSIISCSGACRWGQRSLAPAGAPSTPRFSSFSLVNLDPIWSCSCQHQLSKYLKISHLQPEKPSTALNSHPILFQTKGSTSNDLFPSGPCRATSNACRSSGASGTSWGKRRSKRWPLRRSCTRCRRCACAVCIKVS